MSKAAEAATRQLAAYNAHDLEAFAACYTEDVIVRRFPTGEELCRGRDALRRQYADLLAPESAVHAALVQRMTLGAFAIDLERVTGHRAGGVLGAIAIYETTPEGLISGVWFIGPVPEPDDADA